MVKKNNDGVFLRYEEMSDKPIDDYDENQREIMYENGCETLQRSYRSPLIMRNEKPPNPAPPEYSRNFSQISHIIVNELSETSEILPLLFGGNTGSLGTNNSRKHQQQDWPLDSINEGSFK